MRNGIAATIFRKWLREEICKSVTEENFDKKQIQIIEEQWASQKKIDTEKFAKKRSLILERVHISEENFRLYCINELKSIKWAEERWKLAVEQIYLETKDKYDEVKLQIASIPLIEKGLTLEIYQQLKEGEASFSEVEKYNFAIKCKTDPEGTWIKRTNLPREVSQVLGRLKCGELSTPFKLKDDYIIVRFMEVRGTKLTDDIRKKIIGYQINSIKD